MERPLWWPQTAEEQDGTADHTGEGLIEADAADLPLVIRLVEVDVPGTYPAKGMHVPVEGACNAELVGIGCSERGGEAKEANAPGRKIVIGREMDAETTLGGKADDGLTHFDATGAGGGEEEWGFVTAYNNNGRKKGAWIAPGGRAEGGKGGVNPGGIEADSEFVGTVVGALVVFMEAPGLRIDIGERRSEAIGVPGEVGNLWVIGEGGVGGDFDEHFGERLSKAKGALAEVGSGDNGSGLVEGGRELSLRLRTKGGEEREDDQEGEGDGGHGRPGSSVARRQPMHNYALGVRLHSVALGCLQARTKRALL
jgi:hypothetical protein